MIFLKHKRKVVQALDNKELERLLVDAHDAYVKKQEMKTLIEKAAQLLKDTAKKLNLGLGTWRFEVDRRVVRVVNSTEMEISDPEGLKQVLGSAFDKYVETTVVYKPKKELRELLSNGDSELAQAVKDKVNVWIKTEVRWS